MSGHDRDLQCDANLNTFRDVRSLDFYEVCLPADRSPVLSGYARRMTSLSEAHTSAQQLF
jgi:hypothetical protein